MLSHPCSFRIENMTTTGPTLNECPKISKTFTAFLKSLLALMPNQSARDTSTNDLASANFEQSLDHHCQLDKMEEKAFEMFSHHIDDHKMKKLLSVARGIDIN